MNKWYSIKFSGEYVVSAESEEQAKEFFEIGDLNESEYININSIDFLSYDSTECDYDCEHCDFTECCKEQ
jgi:hypothetical protein